MDSKEAEFVAKLLETFKVEAEEHLKAISDTLLALEKLSLKEQSKEQLDAIFREAHNLKGAARAVNLTKIEALCQEMENILSLWRKKQITLSPKLYDTFYCIIDLIMSCVQSPQGENIISAETLSYWIKELGSLTENSSPIEDVPEKKERAPETSSPSNQPTTPDPPSQPSTKEPILSTEVTSPSSPPPPSENLSSSELPKDKTIRISSSKLDHLLQQIEELLMIKLILNQYHQEHKNVEDLLSTWDSTWNQAQSNFPISPIFQTAGASKDSHERNKSLLQFLDWQSSFVKNLKDTVQRLSKSLQQHHYSINSMIDSLLDDTKQLLMQPFSTLLDTFPRMVRDISHSLGKEIKLEIKGAETEIDRRILEEMKDPLIHLVRNSIDHGIEPPDQRKANQKPEIGTIFIGVSQAGGSQVEIVFRDDGRGVDKEKVKKSALKQGMINEKEAAQLTDQEVLKLIFQSGISTKEQVSNLSGRGVGLGVVAEKVEKLGGHIIVETTPQKGTTFKINLPLALATFRGIHIKVEKYDFIIPTQHVKRALRAFSSEIKTVEGKEAITIDKHTYSYVPLNQLLNIASSKDPKSSENIFILLVKSGDTVLALGVDQILNEQEVLVKGLSKQLLHVKNIAAATIVEEGKVIPILDPFDLIKSVAKNILNPIPSIESDPEKQNRLISVLVAEDSATARILLKNILETAGYQVKLAFDGAEAYSFLKTEEVDLLLTDIEMPRMDGLELTARLRKEAKTKDLPIIICSSKGSKEDRERGIEAGANAYIDKGSFSHNQLLDIIKKLV